MKQATRKNRVPCYTHRCAYFPLPDSKQMRPQEVNLPPHASNSPAITLRLLMVTMASERREFFTNSGYA